MKLLKKKLLFSLLADQPGQDYRYHSYAYLYFRASEFDRGSVRDAANELAAAGLVDRLRRNRRTLFRLTGLGREIFLKETGRSGRGTAWDRLWRLVILTGGFGRALRPLQRQLSRLGFRRLSRGVYLSPGKVTEAAGEIFRRRGWANRVILAETGKVLGADNQQLARNLWQLEKLGLDYDKFITLASRLLRFSRSNLVLLQQSKLGFKAVFDAYFRLWLADPGLPKSLLPPDWPAEEAKSLFFRLVELCEAARL